MPERQEDLKPPHLANPRVLPTMDRFKRVLVIAITIMMGLVLLLAVIELGVILAKDIFTPPVFFLEVTELLELFGLFLLVLIGIELFETMEIYIRENVVHTEVVFAVALIAVARKVIILDVKRAESTSLVGVAAIILALSVGYYLILRAKGLKKRDESEP
jgi:uncharacterized membrane protein (DUF373 family)